MVEGRLRVRLAEWWVLTLLGDVGGFGIGSGCDPAEPEAYITSRRQSR